MRPKETIKMLRVLRRLSTWLLVAGGVGLAAGCHRGTAKSETADESEASATAVQTASPERQSLAVKFDQPGVIEAAAMTDLYPRAAGYVARINVDIGDRVKTGQILLEVDVPELAQDLLHQESLVRQADAEVGQAQAALKAAQGTLEAQASQIDLAEADVKKMDADRRYRQNEFERYNNLATENAATKQMAEEKRFQWAAAESAHESAVAKRKAARADALVMESKVAAAQADVRTKAVKVDVAKAEREKTRVMVEYAKLRAPFDGVITRRTVDEGAYVRTPSSDRATPILQIAKTDWMRIVMHVPEKEVPLVRRGNTARIKLFGREQPVEGKVARYANGLEEKSRTMQVEIDVPNKDGVLYPGMFGSVALTLREIPAALTVPATALYGSGDQLFVVQVKDGKAVRTKVKTGYDDGTVVQIVEGLSGGEEVVVSNKGDLADGQAVAATHIEGRRVAAKREAPSTGAGG